MFKVPQQAAPAFRTGIQACSAHYAIPGLRGGVIAAFFTLCHVTITWLRFLSIPCETIKVSIMPDRTGFTGRPDVPVGSLISIFYVRKGKIRVICRLKDEPDWQWLLFLVREICRILYGSAGPYESPRDLYRDLVPPRPIDRRCYRGNDS